MAMRWVKKIREAGEIPRYFSLCRERSAVCRIPELEHLRSGSSTARRDRRLALYRATPVSHRFSAPAKHLSTRMSGCARNASARRGSSPRSAESSTSTGRDVPLRGLANPGELQGIPAVGRGVPGVIRGTDPVAELLRRFLTDPLAVGLRPGRRSGVGSGRVILAKG